MSSNVLYSFGYVHFSQATSSWKTYYSRIVRGKKNVSKESTAMVLIIHFAKQKTGIKDSFEIGKWYLGNWNKAYDWIVY